MKKLQLMTVLMMFGIVASTELIFAESEKSKGSSSSKGSKSQKSNSQESSSDYDKMSLKELEAAKDAHNQKVKNSKPSEKIKLHKQAIEIAKALNKKQKIEKVSNAQSVKTATTKMQSAKAAKSAAQTAGVTVGGGANKPAPTGQNMPKLGANAQTAQTDKDDHVQGQNMPKQGEYVGSASQGTNIETAQANMQ